MGRKPKQEIDRQIRELAVRGLREVKAESLDEFTDRLRELEWNRVSLAIAPDMVLQSGEGDETIARPGYKLILKADVTPENTYVKLERTFVGLREAQNEASRIKRQLTEAGFIIV